MPAPETEELIQLLNSILSEVVDSKDRPMQQVEELRLRAVWEASEQSDEFRQFGQASAVGLDRLAAEFQDVLRFMLVIGYRLRSAELENSGLELQSGCRLPSAELKSSGLELQSGHRLPSAELENSDLGLRSGYGLTSAELESSDLELQRGCHGTARQTLPATWPGNDHSTAGSQLLLLESARIRRRSVYQSLLLNAMAHHIRGRISLWWRCFLTWSLKAIRTDTFGEKVYLAYKKRHSHRTEPKYPYLSTPDSLSTGSTSSRRRGLVGLSDLQQRAGNGT
jgi:hypothetical protein